MKSWMPGPPGPSVQRHVAWESKSDLGTVVNIMAVKYAKKRMKKQEFATRMLVHDDLDGLNGLTGQYAPSHVEMVFK
jgi:hypothetical protein